MSGHKRTTVTIEQEEYRRLQEADAKLRLAQKSRIDIQTTQAYQNALQDSYQCLLERHTQYEGWIQGMNDQVRRVEGYIHQGLAQQREALFSQVDTLSTSIWTNIDQVLSQQQQNFQVQIDELGRQQDTALNRVNKTIQSIVDQQETKVGLAQSWIDSTQAILQFIEQQYNHHKFTPGKVDELFEQLALAQENLIAGMPEAAITTAQQIYRSTSKLRLKLEFLHDEWQMAYLAACETVDRLFGIIEENWNVSAIDIEGNELDYKVNVDYWTDGMITQAETFLKGVREWLAAQRELISLDELQNLRKEQLLEIETMIHDCRFQARLAVLSSQLRINIADVAITALEQQGFSIQNSGYDRHDQRSSFTATTRHLDGSEVVIKVVPSQEEQIKNDLHVQSNDAEVRTQHELLLRMETIQRTLAGYGLELAPVQVETVPVGPAYVQTKPGRKVSEKSRKTQPG